jgi:hypothetical protein
MVDPAVFDQQQVDELLWIMHEHIIPTALALLPARMNSPEARAMLLAIGLQESGFKYRRQVGGPAEGFWQFERGGAVRGIMIHSVTSPILAPILKVFRYPMTIAGALADREMHQAIQDNDIIACIFARLLLYIDSRALPLSTEIAKGWSIYLAQWRPGKPREHDWPGNFQAAWQIVKG